MAYLNALVYDQGLNHITTNAKALHICSSQPANYTEATTTLSLGYKNNPTISSPQDRTGGGREVVISAITDGSVVTTGTATHWALVDTINSVLIASSGLLNPQVVTSGNIFTLNSFTIGIPAVS